MRRAWLTAIVLAIPSALLALPAAATLAVYEVEGVRGSEAVVDFGDSHLPDHGAPSILTLIGKDGWSKGRLSRAEDRCEYLCGEGDEEGRECHKVGVYALDHALALPAVAVAGEHSVEEVRAIVLEPTREDLARVIDGWVSSEFQVAVNLPPYRSRWSRPGVGQGFDLESEYWSGDQWSTGETRRNVPLSECKVRRYDDFISLRCGSDDRFEWGASWLYHGAKLVLSMGDSDWEREEIDLLSRFALDGSPHYLVRVGSRLGLLERTRDGWRFHPAPKNYATVC